MIVMDCDHNKIVEQSLSGERAIDEQTFASVTVLSDRLNSVRQLGGAFSGISFSPDANKLVKQKDTIAVY